MGKLVKKKDYLGILLILLILILPLTFAFKVDIPIPEETSTTFYPTTFQTLIGTNTSDNITYISYDYDGLIINVSEKTGSPAMDVRINFTSVSSFNDVLLRAEYVEPTSMHEVLLQIYNYNTDTWDTHYELGDSSEMGGTVPIFISDSSNHIDNNLVQVRFYHPDNGNINDKISIDSVQLLKGTTAITTNDHDSLTGRDSTTNHPWAYPYTNPFSFLNSTTLDLSGYWLSNGSSTATGDWDLGSKNLTTIGEITGGDIFTTRYRASTSIGFQLIPTPTGEEYVFFSGFGSYRINPKTTGLWDLGLPTAKWKDLYLSGDAFIDTLTFSGGSITDSSGTISFGNENLTTTGNVKGGNIFGGSANGMLLNWTITDPQINVKNSAGSSRLVADSSAISSLSLVSSASDANKRHGGFYVYNDEKMHAVSVNDAGGIANEPFTWDLGTGETTFNNNITIKGTGTYLYDYKIGSSNQRLWIQSQNPSVSSRIDLFAKDSDATDSVYYVAWAKGQPNDLATNGSGLFFGYYPTTSSYIVSNIKNGAGTLYPITMSATGTWTDKQLELQTDGDVSILATDGDYLYIGPSGSYYIDGYGNVYMSYIYAEYLESDSLYTYYVSASGGIETSDMNVYGDLDVTGKITAGSIDPEDLQYTHVTRQNIIDKYKNWAITGVPQTIEFYNIETGFKEYYYVQLGEFRDSASANYKVLYKLLKPLTNSNTKTEYYFDKMTGEVKSKQKPVYKTFNIREGKEVDRDTGELIDDVQKH